MTPLPRAGGVGGGPGSISSADFAAHAHPNPSRPREGLENARLVALSVPAALLAGALGSQYLGGLYPCEMCHWQRWPHYAAVALALTAFALPRAARPLVILAALAILTSGAIGVYHAGVEAGLFEGFTSCATTVVSGTTAEALQRIMRTPVIRCDQVQFSFLGVSMAGWNALISIAAAILVLWLTRRRAR